MRMRTMTRCRICDQRLDPVWVEIGEDTHPTCAAQEPCTHGEPRGPQACALCRRASRIVRTERAPIDRDVIAVSTKHPKTSHAAAERALPATGTKRRMIIDAIRESVWGLCDWELERKFAWKHESASACRRSLVVDGWLVDSGLTRPVPDTGNDAIVWALAD